jgi:hypothetical protein
MTRIVSGEIPLSPDFDIADFPMSDATLTYEFVSGKPIVVRNARIVALRQDDRVLLLFEGVTDDEQAMMEHGSVKG